MLPKFYLDIVEKEFLEQKQQVLGATKNIAQFKKQGAAGLNDKKTKATKANDSNNERRKAVKYLTGVAFTNIYFDQLVKLIRKNEKIKNNKGANGDPAVLIQKYLKTQNTSSIENINDEQSLINLNAGQNLMAQILQTVLTVDTNITQSVRNEYKNVDDKSEIINDIKNEVKDVIEKCSDEKIGAGYIMSIMKLIDNITVKQCYNEIIAPLGTILNRSMKETLINSFVNFFPDMKNFQYINLSTMEGITFFDAWQIIKKEGFDDDVTEQLKQVIQNVAPSFDSKLKAIYASKLERAIDTGSFNQQKPVQQKLGMQTKPNVQQQSMPENILDLYIAGHKATYEDIYNEAKILLEEGPIKNALANVAQKGGNILTAVGQTAKNVGQTLQREGQARGSDPSRKAPSQIIKNVIAPDSIRRKDEALRYVIGFVTIFAVGSYFLGLQNAIQPESINEDVYTESLIGKAVGWFFKPFTNVIKSFTGLPTTLSSTVRSGSFSKYITKIIEMSRDDSTGFGNAMSKMGLAEIGKGLKANVFTAKNLKNLSKRNLSDAAKFAQTRLHNITVQDLQGLFDQVYEKGIIGKTVDTLRGVGQKIQTAAQGISAKPQGENQ